MAYDLFVIRLSSWPMLSIWPPTKPTMTDSGSHWFILAVTAKPERDQKSCQRLDKLSKTRAVFNAQESPESSLVNVIPQRQNVFFQVISSKEEGRQKGPVGQGEFQAIGETYAAVLKQSWRVPREAQTSLPQDPGYHLVFQVLRHRTPSRSWMTASCTSHETSPTLSSCWGETT